MTEGQVTGKNERQFCTQTRAACATLQVLRSASQKVARLSSLARGLFFRLF